MATRPLCLCPTHAQELTGFLGLFAHNAALLSRPFCLEYIPVLFDACVSVVGALTEDSLRSLSKDFAPDITNSLRVLLRRIYSKEETGKRVEVRRSGGGGAPPTPPPHGSWACGAALPRSCFLMRVLRRWSLACARGVEPSPRV
jgi:hypothetical protein